MSHMRGRWVRSSNFCVFVLLSFESSFCETHQSKCQLLQVYGKAGRIQTCQKIKTRANFDKNNHQQASSIHVQVYLDIYIYNEHRIWRSSAYSVLLLGYDIGQLLLTC